MSPQSIQSVLITGSAGLIGSEVCQAFDRAPNHIALRELSTRWDYDDPITGIPQRHHYVDTNRIGDHICYYSDLRKMRAHYPKWTLTRSLPQIFEEIAEGWRTRSVIDSSLHAPSLALA